MKHVMIVLVCVLAMCAVVGYVSADAGGMAKVRELAVRQAFSANAMTFDLYACTNVVPLGAVFVDPGCKAYAADGTDISDRIVATPLDGEIDTNVANAIYQIEYNVTDLNGIAAEPFIRRVVVIDTRPPRLEGVGCDEF